MNSELVKANSNSNSNNCFFVYIQHMSHLMTKPTKWHVRPKKTQISLGIRPVWSVSSLSAWRKLGSLVTHWAHSEDSDQTGWMPRLIWVFAGRTCHFVGFVMSLMRTSVLGLGLLFFKKIYQFYICNRRRLLFIQKKKKLASGTAILKSVVRFLYLDCLKNSCSAILYLFKLLQYMTSNEEFKQPTQMRIAANLF